MNGVYNLPGLYDEYKPGWTAPYGKDAQNAQASAPNFLTACACGIPVWVWLAGAGLLIWALWPKEERIAEEIVAMPRRRNRARRRRAA